MLFILVILFDQSGNSDMFDDRIILVKFSLFVFVYSEEEGVDEKSGG